MATLAALPSAIWEPTPPAAQAYIRALEMRVAALESGMQALHAQLQQTSQHSSRPPASDPPAYLAFPYCDFSKYGCRFPDDTP
jgi:Family of unknown function (DUF6444)